MVTPMELLNFDYINPIKCIYHRPIGKKYVVSHWHEAIEVVYVSKGNPGTMFIEENKYSLEEGDIYVINSRLIHSFDTVITNQQRIVTLLINYDWLRQCLPNTVKNKAFDLIKAPKKDSQKTALNDLIKLIKELRDFQIDGRNEVDQLNRLSVEVEFISILIKNFVVDKEVSHQIPPIIAEIIAEFHAKYQTDIQLYDMAKKYNYSYAYFSKFFKKYLGISPKKYLTLLRIQNAAELIERTDDRFSKIAAKTGFPDEKSFYASFKDKYELTPLEYRKQTQMID